MHVDIDELRTVSVKHILLKIAGNNVVVSCLMLGFLAPRHFGAMLHSEFATETPTEVSHSVSR